MKIAAIIAEYNPFHNGHEYQIQKVREITGADYVVIATSGNFVQRGEPALLDKYTRTRIALYGGADCVIELPVCYATGSAEFFAMGAVALLHKLNCIDYLCFGCEVPNTRDLSAIAQMLSEEPAAYQNVLQSCLKQGMSYPSARQQALLATCDFIPDDKLQSILSQPNNILAIEYLKAMTKLSCSMQPIAIQRTGSAYHSDTLQGCFSSATAIRNSLGKEPDWVRLSQTVNPHTLDMIKESYQHTMPITLDDFSMSLYTKMLDPHFSFEPYADYHEDLSRRLQKQWDISLPITTLITKTKTKAYTYTRISRYLLHILLDIQSCDMTSFLQDEICYYVRLLGFRENSGTLLQQIKQNSQLPVITKPAHAKTQLTAPLAKKMWDTDIHAAQLYSLVVSHKFGTKLCHEYQRSPEHIL